MASKASRTRSALERLDKPGRMLDPPNLIPLDPPVRPRLQTLPFSALGWEDFERLCLRLAREDGEPEDWRLYGARGQAQGGIDILVRQSTSGRYVVWQAKRHRKFTAAKVREAVRTFLCGEWADKAERFVLCASASFEDTQVAAALEIAAQQLRARGIVLDPRDPAKLAELLKDLPAVVDDFFDRPWTEAFCGREAVQALGDRLARRDFANLRDRLEQLYQAHFLTIDPGVLRASGVARTPKAPLPLSVRFVPPDLFAVSGFADDAWMLSNPGPNGRAYASVAETPLARDQPSDRDVRTLRRREPRRLKLSTWSLDAERAVIVGAPGTGKSTLLRFLAMDLLSAEPRLTALRERYPGRLPIWISFPFWTRQIQTQQPGVAISLEGVLSAWLRAHGEEDLVTLVQRAIQDRRVVVLVDGVDEWADETSAVTAIGLLNTFVETRKTPAIVTSRPHGARVLNGLDSSWRRHELAPLDKAQQLDFAIAWCEFLLGDRAEGASNPGRRRAEQFLADAHRSPQIAPLTGVPLLLGGLLALSLTGADLPDSRYRAYEELTRRLLEAHPRARDQAALMPSGRDELDPQTRERVLSGLAFEIQRQASSQTGLDSIGNATAEAFCKDFLVEAIDLPAHLARDRARQLIRVGRETLGILVEKSPTEVGFLHRAFQEFLAARHIASLELDHQLELLRAHATDPRWREIFLFVLQACDRQSDVERMVEALANAAPNNPQDNWSLDLLLAEVAFGETRRSTATAKRLATQLFTYIETGSDQTQRAELLKRVVAGLTREQNRVLLLPKLREWLPDWHGGNRRDALRLMIEWTDEKAAVDGVLWRNLQSDDLDLRLQAAVSFARLHAGAQEALDRLARLVNDPPSVEAAAAALTAIHAGWPQTSCAVEILEAAADCATADLTIIGIAARVARGDRRDGDRDRLLALFDADQWPSGEALADVLVAGWSGDLSLKPVLLVDDPLWSFVGERRLPTAMRAFPQDDEVARAVLKVARNGGGMWLPLETLGPLAQHFRGHRLIGEAIDLHVEAMEPKHYLLARLADIHPSETVKAKLLGCLASPAAGVDYIVDALDAHWGLSDPAVASALSNVASWPAARIAEIADRLPNIVADPERCRRVLVAALVDCVKSRDSRCDHFFEGLRVLGVAVPETVVTDLLNYDFEAGGELAWVNACGLMAAFSSRPEVISLATRLLERPTGVVSGVASWLSDGAGIKAAVLRVCAPLPAFQRLVLLDLLADRAVDNKAAFDLVALAGLDAKHEIASASLLAETRARQARDQISDEYLERLTQAFAGDGLAIGGRRVGALAALALLDRLDLFEARRKDTGSIDMGIWFPEEAARPMQAFAQAWGCVQRDLDPQEFSHLLRLGRTGLVEHLLPYADQSPEARDYVRREILAQEDGGHTTTFLRQMVRESGGGGRTLDACMSQLSTSGRAWPSQSAAYTAAEIIGHDHAENPHLFRRIVEMIGDQIPAGPVSALCEGWPTCAELDAIFQRLVSDDVLAAALPTPLAMKIVAAKSGVDSTVQSLAKAANEMTGGVWDGIPHWLPNFTRRLRQDEALVSALLTHLRGRPTAGEKVSFASLLIQTQGLTPALASWCETALQSAGQALVAEAGMDLWLGQVVLVRPRLIQLVRGEHAG